MWKWETNVEPKGIVVIVHDMMEYHGNYAYTIMELRKRGFHIFMGDLPGHGETSRANKGHIEHFEQYNEKLFEWLLIASRYEVPCFIIGQGLGGLIVLNALEKTEMKVEGIMLINPLLEFNHELSSQKKLLSTSLGSLSKEGRFDLGITSDMLTSDKTMQQSLNSNKEMYREVTYHWYREVHDTMRETIEKLDQIQDLPVAVYYSKHNQVINSKEVNVLKSGLNSTFFNYIGYEKKAHHLLIDEYKDYVIQDIDYFMHRVLNEIGFNY